MQVGKAKVQEEKARPESERAEIASHTTLEKAKKVEKLAKKVEGIGFKSKAKYAILFNGVAGTYHCFYYAANDSDYFMRQIIKSIILNYTGLLLLRKKNIILYT